MVIKTNKNYRAKLNENDRQNTTLCHISVAKKETPSLHPWVQSGFAFLSF